MKALFIFLLSYNCIWATDDLKTKAANKEIKVEDVKYREGDFDKEKSIISWKLKVEPKQVVKKQLSYVVKYPKEKRVNL